MTDLHDRFNAIPLLKDLVRIPSESPSGNEVAIASYISDRLHSAKIKFEVVERTLHRPNLIARIHGGPGPVLTFQGHLDTKPASHATSAQLRWSNDPFSPVVRDGKLYGLGACDTKGGVAAQLAAILALAETSPWGGTLVWQGVADEENGSFHGAEYLSERGLLAATAAVVSEPTNNVITTAQLGNCWLDILISGVAAHAGTPWKGSSATDAAFELVAEIKNAIAALPIDDRFPGHPRLNVGLIQGGHHAGTVPGECRIVTDIRVRPNETRNDHANLVKTCVATIERRCNVKMTLSEFANGGCESNEVPKGHPFVDAIHTAWQTLEHENAPLGVFFGGSDARYFARHGVPTVVFGPGSLEQAHAVDEWVELAEVIKASQFYEKLAKSVLAGQT